MTSAYDPEKSRKGSAYDVEVLGADGQGHIQDAVFGDVGEDGPNYRNVGWMGSCVLMTKANVGLGVLSIPSVLDKLGMVPGIIIIIVVNIIITWSDYQIGTFKLRHPAVYGLADAGGQMWGRGGQEFLGICFCLYMIFVAGSAIVGVATSLNAVSLHATCTAVFFAVSAICGFLLASIRTLGSISWLGWVGVISIVSSIITLTVACGVTERPAMAPQEGPWSKTVQIAGNPATTFATAMNAVAATVFAAAATPTYFGIISEMRDPRQYTKSLLISQGFVTLLYCVIGGVVYGYVGQWVAVPALGSAGLLMKRICYGIAIPALLVTLCIYTHMAAKFIFVRILRGTRHLAHSTPIHWITWLSCTAGSVLISYIIASAIPVFGALIDFIGALLCPTICMWPYACMWFYDHFHLYRREEGDFQGTRVQLFKEEWRMASSRKKLQAIFAAFVILVAIFITVGGLYGAVEELIDVSKHNDNSPWSCNDNSNTRWPNGTLVGYENKS